MCGSCGVALIITDERGNTFTGYSPFTAEEYKAKSTQKMPVAESNKKTK
jgi:hypothetical protein